jgi:glutaredoxin
MVNKQSCPWCKSEKIMAEIYQGRGFMVCQKCLARGPEINIDKTKSYKYNYSQIINSWNYTLK